MTLRRDEGGVFQIVEAILVAVLVATALIFFALVQKPPAGSSGEGQELAQAAADALDIKKTELMTFIGTSGTGPIFTNEAGAREALEEVLPDDVKFTLNATNAAGLWDSVSGPEPSVGKPRNAQAASIYIWAGQVVLLELVVWSG